MYICTMLQKIVSFFKGLFAKTAPSAWDLARAQNAALLKEWGQKYGDGKEVALQEVFSTGNGWVFYSYSDIGNLSVIRHTKIQEQLTKLLFAVTPHYLQSFEQMLAQAVAAGNTGEIKRLGMQLAANMKTAPSLLAIAELGALLLIRHDENPYTYNHKIHVEKVKLIQTDDDAQFFFANTGAALQLATAAALGEPMLAKLAGWKLTSGDAIPAYLESLINSEATKATN